MAAIGNHPIPPLPTFTTWQVMVRGHASAPWLVLEGAMASEDLAWRISAQITGEHGIDAIVVQSNHAPGR